MSLNSRSAVLPMSWRARAWSLDPGEFDEDAVGPLLDDRGLGDAELVDAVADGLEPLVDRVGADPVGLGGAHLQADLAGVVLLDLEGRVLGDLLADLVERRVGGRHEDNRRQPFAPHGPDREALAPQRVAQFVGDALGGVLHRLVHLDAEDEVHAALQVESEAQLLHRHQLVPPGRHLPGQRRHEADRPGRQRGHDDPKTNFQRLRHLQAPISSVTLSATDQRPILICTLSAT